MATILLEINGAQVEHQIDEAGNATLNGEIKFTKEELDALNQEPPAEPEPPAGGEGGEEVTFDMITQASGINILDDAGNPRSYDMTTEGFANWGKDIHNSGYKMGSENAMKDLFEQNPDLYDMYKYKQEKGTLEGYAHRPNLKDMVIDDTTEEQVMWDVIYAAEIAQGKTPERAKKIADYSKANESLKDDADDSLNILKKLEGAADEARRTAAEKAARDSAELENRYYGVTYENGKEKVLNIEGSMYDLVVNKGTVGDLFIPATGIKIKDADGKDKQLTRKDVFNYMSKPVKEINGVLYTQAQLDEYTRMQTLQNATQQFLLNLTGKDAASTLINRAATAKVIKIINNNSNKGNGGGKGNPPANGGGDKPKVVLPV